MSKKKKYPKWFSPHSKPFSPTKPSQPNKTSEVYTKRLVLSLNYDGDCYEMPDIKLNEGEKLTVELQHDRGYYDGDPCDVKCEIYVKEKTIVENPHYKQDMQKYRKSLESYKKEYEEYKINVKEWEKYKEKWNEEIQQEKDEKERKQYEKERKQYEALKKKFG